MRPQVSVAVFDQALKMIEQASAGGRPLLLVGDFNCRHPQLGDNVKPSTKANRFLTFLGSNYLTVLNTRDAWGVGTRDSSVLDLAITSHPHLFKMRVNQFPLQSDHLSITVQVLRPSSPPPPSPAEVQMPRWSIKKADWSIFHNQTQHHFSNFFYNQRSVMQSLEQSDDRQGVIDKLASRFTADIIACADRAIPRSKPRPQFSTPLLPALQDQFHQVQLLKKRMLKVQRRVKRDRVKGNSSSAALSRSHTLTQLKVQLEAAREQWKKAEAEHNTRKWDEFIGQMGQDVRRNWRIWHRSIPSTNRIMNSLTSTESGQVPSSMKDSLNNMAEFYSQVMSDDAMPSWSGHAVPRKDSELQGWIEEFCNSRIAERSPSRFDHLFSVEEVTEAAKSMRKTTAPGPDAVSAAFLAKGSTVFYQAITNIFNGSWVHGVIPLEWKKANAFALFKKGDHSDPSAYRIISITSVIMRLFERVVYWRTVQQLDSDRFFTDSQAGFRKHLSTLDCIYKLLRDVYSSLRSRKQLPVIFLDIIKAFDRVPHQFLLFKLYAHAGVGGAAWGWYRAFLSDRLFRVGQGGHFSDWFSASAGVPQGCVLSPLLFAIYINDLGCDAGSSLYSLMMARRGLVRGRDSATPSKSRCCVRLLRESSGGVRGGGLTSL